MASPRPEGPGRVLSLSQVGVDRGTHLPGTHLAPHDDRFRHEKPAGTVAPAVPAGSYLGRDTWPAPGAQHIGNVSPMPPPAPLTPWKQSEPGRPGEGGWCRRRSRPAAGPRPGRHGALTRPPGPSPVAPEDTPRPTD